MGDCNLDDINMCCWTHHCDIDSADYAEGYCAQGWWEHENEAWEGEPFNDEPRWDDDESQSHNPNPV